jgi:hypothetical protein
VSEHWGETTPINSVGALGRAINHRRHALHFSQRKLGASAEVPPAAISRLELERDDTVSLGVVLRLVDKLGFDLELRPRGSRFVPRPPTSLCELGLSPGTMSALETERLESIHQLGTATEILVRPAFADGTALFEIVCALNRHGLSLSTNRTHIPSSRDRAILKLRIIEGRTLKEIARACGLNDERVRQILHAGFGLTGRPPSVTRRRNERARQRQQGK